MDYAESTGRCEFAIWPEFNLKLLKFQSLNRLLKNGELPHENQAVKSFRFGLRKVGSDFMSFQEVSAERLAELFHHYHEALQPGHEPQGKHPMASWTEVSEQEKCRMITAARLTLLELDSEQPRRTHEQYFATPGEAEWGC